MISTASIDKHNRQIMEYFLIEAALADRFVSARRAGESVMATQLHRVVEVQGLSKVFGAGDDAVTAIKSVTFDVAQRECVTLLGPSGCGKSTLLMAIAGLEMPTLGQIKVNGEPVRGPVASLGIAFQDATLLPWKSAIENVLYPARIRGQSLASIRQDALDMLALVGLSGFGDRKPHELSGGMRQRVALCRALVYHPHLLLLDEPFSALDAITREEMNVLLLNLLEKVQTAALLVTHSISEAILLSDRILVLSDRPARIIADVVVPFPRPRSAELFSTAECTALSSKLRGLITQLRLTSAAGSGTLRLAT